MGTTMGQPLSATRPPSTVDSSTTLTAATTYANGVGTATLTSANGFATNYANGVGASTLAAAKHP